MDRTEQIYRLVKQWCCALDPRHADEALRQIAILTGCIPQPPRHFSEQENQHVMQWLQDNHPNAYLWAMSQQWIGHPAMVWGAASSARNPAAKKR